MRLPLDISGAYPSILAVFLTFPGLFELASSEVAFTTGLNRWPIQTDCGRSLKSVLTAVRRFFSPTSQASAQSDYWATLYASGLSF